MLKDNANERIIQYNEDESTVKIIYNKIYNKKDITFTVERIVNGVLTTQVIKQEPMTRGNSSMFSAWKYSNSGNKWTLTAVINGKTVSKTRTKTTSNKNAINRFCDAVDDIRSAEWDIIIEIGPVAGGGLLFAALTGGIGIPAALAAIGASASALLAGDRINTYYARAKSAYNSL